MPLLPEARCQEFAAKVALLDDYDREDAALAAEFDEMERVFRETRAALDAAKQDLTRARQSR